MRISVASLDFHPWRCSHPNSVPREVIMRVLHLVLFAQWCATIHAFRLQDREVFQRYDCLPSALDAAPGVSSCSADLCSKTWLLSNPDLLSDSDETALMFYKIPTGVAFSAYPFSPIWLGARQLPGTPYWTPPEAGGVVRRGRRGQEVVHHSALCVPTLRIPRPTLRHRHLYVAESQFRL